MRGNRVMNASNCVQGLDDPRLRAALVRSLRARVAPADVDDVVQATLVEALTASARPASAVELQRFIFHIAKQKAADVYRRRARESYDEELDAAATEGEAGEQELLRWAAAQLPTQPDAPKTLQWMLMEADGEPLEHIATAEGLPPAVVRQRVSRLRRHFRALWRKELAMVSALLLMLSLGAMNVLHGGGTAEVLHKDPTGSRPKVSQQEAERQADIQIAALDLSSCVTKVKSPFTITFIFGKDGRVKNYGTEASGNMADSVCMTAQIGAIQVDPFEGSFMKTKIVSPPAPSRPADCNPPYVVDGQGYKHYKKDCLSP
jgi:DNA-directed RNA polymerase specialized sigma24 family protein